MASYWICFTIFLVLTEFSKAIVWQDNDGGPVRWAMDCNFEGNGTSEKPLDSFEKCGNLCQETRNCDHFTWTNHQGGICMMKYSNYSIQSSIQFQKLALNQTGSVCGYLQISWNKDVNNTLLGTSDWGYNCLMLGFLTGKFLPVQISKREECGLICSNNSDCNGFTWKPDDEWCVMSTGGYVSKDFATYSPHSFCGVIQERNANYSWFYILFALVGAGAIIFLIKNKIMKMFRPRYSRRH